MPRDTGIDALAGLPGDVPACRTRQGGVTTTT